MKNGFHLIWYFGDKVDAHKHVYLSTNYFILTLPEEEAWPGGALPMSLAEA